MTDPRNACEAVLANPELHEEVKRMVQSEYKLHRITYDDAAFDLEDLQQELYLALCEEAVQPNYLLLVERRLKDIARDLSRRNRGCDEYTDDYEHEPMYAMAQ